MRRKPSCHFVSFKTETSDLYSWPFIHSNCLYALNSLNRELLFSKCFVQISHGLFTLVYLLYIKDLARLCFEAIFLKHIWKGPFFHDPTWATFSHDIGKMSLVPNLNCRACVISTKTPPCCFVHLNKLIPQFIETGKWLRIPTWF